MKFINFLLAIAMVVSVMTLVNANEQNQRSKNLFRDRLIELLLDAKQRELSLTQQKEAREPDNDHYKRQFVRRKVVGISDNPF